MKIRDSVAFVTGANRGIGLAFTQALLAAGARKVYAAARNPEHITLDGVSRVRLDVTKPDTITAAANQCTDVNLLINNAGIAVSYTHLDVYKRQHAESYSKARPRDREGLALAFAS